MKRFLSTRDGLFKAANAEDIVFIFGKDNTRSHRLEGVHFSYASDPDAAYLLIEILDPESVSTWRTVGKHYITKGGPGPLEFVGGYETPVNTGLRVTLSSGGVEATLELRGYELVGRN